MIDEAYTNPLGFDLEPNPAANEDEFKARALELYELDVAFKQTFSTKNGRKVLEFLRKATIESAAWQPSLVLSSGLETANAHAYAREGQIDTVDTVVDAILVDTAEIGAAGAGLSAIPWNASWDAEVQSEVTDALNAYDPPTKAELDSGLAALNDPTAAAIADAVWDESTTGHTTAGTFGEQVKTDIDAILADTNELQSDDIPGTLSTIEGKIDTIDTVVDAILVDTGTTLDTAIAAIPTATKNAEALLKIDMSTVTGEASRSPLNALRFP